MKKSNFQECPFTESELKILNLSDSEMSDLLDAHAIAATAEMLPENPDKLIDRMNKEFPDDAEGIFKKYAELCKTDPEFIIQIIAMTEAMSEIKIEDQSKAKVEKITAAAIKQSKTADDINKINKLLGKK